MRFPTYQDVQKYGPTIGTIFSCVGTIATGLLSARAMYKYMKAAEYPCDNTKEAIKAIIPPVVMGAATITSFILVRRADSRAIAGLSASVAALSMQLHETNEAVRDEFGEEGALKVKQRVAEKAYDPEGTIVIDPEGELYYISNPALWVRVKSDKIAEAFKNVNRGYNFFGFANWYTFLRTLGMKKKQIEKEHLDWTKYMGWNYEDMSMSESYYIEDEVGQVEEGYHIINVDDWLVKPICINPPDYVHFLCHSEEEDLSYLNYTRDDIDEIIAPYDDEE